MVPMMRVSAYPKRTLRGNGGSAVAKGTARVETWLPTHAM